jgi:hypothetical protein
MKRRKPFTHAEIEKVRAFALRIGLGFARDQDVADDRRRFCIHEAGHIVIYAGLGITGWRVRIHEGGAETSMPPTAVSSPVCILMALGGPLAEEAHCGPSGVFLAAVDDLWQVKEAAAGLTVVDLRVLVAQGRQVLAERKRFVLAIADLLAKRGEFSEDDIDEVEAIVATKRAS